MKQFLVTTCTDPSVALVIERKGKEEKGLSNCQNKSLLNGYGASHSSHLKSTSSTVISQMLQYLQSRPLFNHVTKVDNSQLKANSFKRFLSMLQDE